MLNQVKATMDSLSPAEKRVGKLVMANPTRFASMSTSEIAHECFVSKPTVTRFCKGLGYEGLTQFKRKLRCKPGDGIFQVHPSVEETDSTANVALKVIGSSMSSLATFRTHVPQVAIEQATQHIEGAYSGGRTVSFYGSGHSGIVAQDAQLRFSRLGVSGVACCEGYSQIVNAAARKEGDVVLAFSSSGRTKELLESVDVAKCSGATVIVLTSTDTPLAAMGSIHIATDPEEEFEQCITMSSRLLQLVVTDILATAVAIKIGGFHLQGPLERTHSLLRHRYYG